METKSGENTRPFSGPFPSQNNGKNRKDELFRSGRGNVSGMVNKSLDGTTDIGVADNGGRAQNSGARPVFAAGDMPFHKGAGAGRGH